jgi:hypothetical protein
MEHLHAGMIQQPAPRGNWHWVVDACTKTKALLVAGFLKIQPGMGLSLWGWGDVGEQGSPGGLVRQGDAIGNGIAAVTTRM